MIFLNVKEYWILAGLKKWRLRADQKAFVILQSKNKCEIVSTLWLQKEHKSSISVNLVIKQLMG